MELNEKQKEALNICVARYKSREPYTCIAGYAGTGKAQPNNTLIPTPNGMIALGDLKIGDLVFDRLGRPTKIIGIYPQGKQDVYEVIFKDGRKTLCNNNHLWGIYNSYKAQIVTKSLQDIINQGLTQKSGLYKQLVPLCEPVQYPEKNFSIDPYVVGCFLGDGYCVSPSLTFSSKDVEIVQNIANKINSSEPQRKAPNEYTWFFKLPLNLQTPKRYLFHTEDIFEQYQNEIMQYSESKRIPTDYLQGSIEQRWELLRGLMDTDGSINAQDKYHAMRFTTISKDLANDFLTLINSLGFTGSTYIDQRSDKYPTTGVCYSISINAPANKKPLFFNLERKKQIAIQHQKEITRKRFDYSPIVKVNKLNYQEEMTCIMVDNSEHLYLTNDYIVTHNTTVVKFIISALGLNPDEDVSFISYTGKSASVLRRAGCPNAITAHKLLYSAKLMSNGKYKFYPRKKLEVERKLLVIDEVSMLPKKLWDLALTHHVPIIALGDPAQLPPISADDDNHVLDNPHCFLTQIHRQAADSEIINLSMNIRNSKPLYPYKGKEVQVVNRNELVDGMYYWADQIICATNRQRKEINDEMRKAAGRGELPENGDKVICCRNNWDITDLSGEEALVNGTIGYLQNISFEQIDFHIWGIPAIEVIIADIHTDDGLIFPQVIIDKQALMTGKKTFSGQQEYQIKKKSNFVDLLPVEFNYGYAITCHRSQGSQWDKVLVLEENFPRDKDEHRRWIYTAATRPTTKLVVVRK